VEAPAPAKPETAAIEETPVNVEPEPVVEEEPVRKSFFSGSQMSSIRQTGADIDSEQTQRAEEARIAEEERREAERIAEQKRLAQIVEEKRLTEESRREAERQAAQQAAEAQRIAAEQRQKAAAAQQAAAQQAEAERQRQIREAQAQEQARIAAATSAQVRQQTLQVPSEPINLVGTIWNCIEIETDEQYGSSDNVFHFKKRGVLKCPTICDGTWVQNGNSVTIEFDIGDACLTIELKIINAELMQGTSELTDDDEETNPVELRRKK
jgi:multidrug efflux pump subunit AcrA (membrane-fusion protein)